MHAKLHWNGRSFLTCIACVICIFAVRTGTAQSGTWAVLTNQPPYPVDTLFLMTDGTVLANGDWSHGASQSWYKLAPDASGSYVNGAWTAMAVSHVPRLYYASSVLIDGRLLVSGGAVSTTGRYGRSNITTTEAYDPILNVWTYINPPAYWTHVGDAPCCTLPDGTVLLGSIDNTNTAIYNPSTDTFSAGPTKSDTTSSDESWALLPNNTVLVVESHNHPAAEKYLFSNSSFNSAGTVVADLVDPSLYRVGAAVVRPDGTAFCIGATNVTDIYTMPTDPTTQTGTWTQGPALPSGLGAEDAPAALLPDGNVLFTLGPTGTVNGPTTFFEFDGAHINQVSSTGDSTIDSSPPYYGRMLVLPTGQVMYTCGTSGDRNVYVYTPSGSASPTWAPVITNVSATLQGGGTYTLQGEQLNGLSQGTFYGDDAAAATNYPLVRLTNTSTGGVVYCRTHDHSTMGIATGSAVESTSFDVPITVPTGTYDLAVVANGIASAPVTVSATGANAATLSTVAVNPTSVAGGASSTGTVTLSAVQSVDTFVKLTSRNVTAAQVPASITIPAGQTSGTFTVTTNVVNLDTSLLVIATSANTVSTSLKVQGLSVTSFTVNPNTIPSYGEVTGTVTISGNAVGSGAVVSLSSSPLYEAYLPSTVTVPAGSNTVSFAVGAGFADNSYTVTLTATFNGGSQSTSLTVTPSDGNLADVSMSPSTVTGGSSSTGTVTVAYLQYSDTYVSLSSSNTAVAQVPSSVTIPAGQTSATFTVTTSAVSTPTTVTISAASGLNTVTGNLTVQGVTISSVSANPSSVKGGQQSTGTVTLGSPASQSMTVKLSSSRTSAATVPSTVTIPAGSSSANFTISTSAVATDTKVTITATLNGSSVKTVLTVTGPHLSSFTLNPTTVKGGNLSVGTVTIDSTSPFGETVKVHSSKPTVASVPATVTIQPGKTSATFTVTTYPVTTTTAVTISVTFNGKTLSQRLSVTP